MVNIWERDAESNDALPEIGINSETNFGLRARREFRRGHRNNCESYSRLAALSGISAGREKYRWNRKKLRGFHANIPA